MEDNNLRLECLKLAAVATQKPDEILELAEKFRQFVMALPSSDMGTFIDETDQSFYDDYLKATQSNQPGNLFKQVLLACAIAPTDDNGFFIPGNVVTPLSDILDRPIEIANFQRHLTEFITEERGKILIRRGAERQYRFRFRDPMMQPYLFIRGLREKMIPQSLLN